MSGPAPRPVVAGVRGGIGARLAAIATAVALIGVVWVGTSGKPAATPVPSPVPLARVSSTGTPQARITARPTAAASASPVVLRPPQAPTPAPTSVLDGDQALVATGSVGDESFELAFTEARPGVFVAEHWTHSPPTSDVLEFEITDVRRRPGLGRTSSVGGWSISLAELAGNARAGTSVLTATAPARPRLTRAPLPVRRGFALEVSVRLAFQEVAVVYLRIRVGEKVRNQVQGDDGFMGCRGFLSCDHVER